MLHYIIEVSLCWSVFYLLYHFWLSRETFFSINRWYLLGSLLLGLCIPLLNLPALAAIASEPLTVVYQAPVIIGADWLEVTVSPESKTVKGLTFWQILADFYWLGFSVAMLRFIFGLTQLYKLYRDAEVIVRQGFKLVQTKQAHLPFSFFNLLFQSKEMRLVEEEEQQIHRHELAHISGWHSIDVLFLELVSIVLWCSPLVYLYRSSLRDVHEFLADAAVLRTTRRKQYSKLLLRQFQSGLQLALANHFIRSQFKNRINMMTKRQSQSEALLKYLLILPALVIAIFLFAKRTALAEEMNLDTEDTIQMDANIQEDSIRKLAEVMPRYPGCEELKSEKEKEACSQKEFLTYIYKNILYPEEARSAGIQGTVIVSFVIDEKGNLQQPEIEKEPGAGLGAEVVRLLKEMPQWRPGQDKGKAVAVQMTLPIKYALENEQKTEKPPVDQYDVMPVFAGCEGLTDPGDIKLCTAKKLQQFIMDNVKYPAEAKELGIEGKVFVQLTIDEKGKIANAEVEREVNGGLEEEALRVIKLMPDWKPALKNGEAVNVKLTIPIHFDLPIEHKAVVVGYGKQSNNEQSPRFPGCEDETDEKGKISCSQKKFLTYVFNTIKYPKAAKDNKVEGTVIASFDVDEKGRIGEVKILRSVGHGTDEEVERVLLNMNDLSEKWIPAQKDGKAIKAKVTLPVKFALSKDQTSKDVAPLPLKLKDFNLSPNPNNGQFRLAFEAEALPIHISVTDATGKVVLEEKLKDFSGRYQGEIELKQKAKGTYFLAIMQEGKGRFNHTFIVQ